LAGQADYAVRVKRATRPKRDARQARTRMLDVLSVTLPIFILIALGFAATRLGAATAADIEALGSFVIRFALPALIFNSLAQRPFAEIANARYFAAYVVGSVAVFAAMFALARALKPGDRAREAIQALGSSCSNTGFVGYPVALLFVGPRATVAVALTMVVENLVIMPLALALAESGGHAGKRSSAAPRRLVWQLARNPLIIAIALGAATSLAGVALPTPLARAVNMLAMASSAVALFVVGGMLVGLQVGGVTRDAARIVAGKLFLLPAAVFVAQLALAPALDPDLRKSMLIFASAPTLSIFPLLGRQYGQERVCAASVVMATGLSFLTMSALLLVL
jgi:predicted permease